MADLRLPPGGIRFSWRDPVQVLAFGCGAGLAPKAPGTVGTLAAIPFFFLLEPCGLVIYSAVTGLLLLLGIAVCGRASRHLGVHDHPGIVWDEIVGYLVTMVGAPQSWLSVLLGFLWFRLFDIWKPWPIGWLDQRVTGGLGIMLDDVLAGIFALCALQASLRLLL